MADDARVSDRELIDRLMALLGTIDDDSALAGCVELLDHALPSEGEQSWTKGRVLAFFVELTSLLARASVGGLIHEVDEVDERGAETSKFRYYRGAATHSRSQGPAVEFTGTVNMVRVELPRRVPDPEAFGIETRIGRVLARDHGVLHNGVIDPVFSVERINELYQDSWSDPGVVAREVDLITGARIAPVPIDQLSFRFTPVSLFIAYDAARRPIFFVVQSSFFDGKPSKLYVAKHMQHVIEIESGYRPTPFAQPLNHYRIELTMAGDEPKQLVGEMYTSKSLIKYLTVSIVYALEQPAASPGGRVLARLRDRGLDGPAALSRRPPRGPAARARAAARQAAALVGSKVSHGRAANDRRDRRGRAPHAARGRCEPGARAPDRPILSHREDRRRRGWGGVLGPRSAARAQGCDQAAALARRGSARAPAPGS
jgi:hypothetical protein